jgi:enoyl-CoA hydratase/carnithine racemase
MARLGAALRDMERGPWVTVAVVEGYALAGGLELMLASDIVIAATDARIGDRHAEYGLAPAAGGSIRLSRAVSPAFTRYLMLTGTIISGQEAVERGLVSLAVEPAAIDAEIQQVVDRLRSRGRGALLTIKAMLTHSEGHREDRLHRRELELFLAHIGDSPDARVGLKAFGAGTTPSFDRRAPTPVRLPH